MKVLLTLLFALTLLGCGRESNPQARLLSSEGVAAPATSTETEGDLKAQPRAAKTEPAATTEPKEIQDSYGDQTYPNIPLDRKILKDAVVTLEVSNPLEAQRKINSIAGARGGFVVTSESKQQPSSDPHKPVLDLILVIRVPASQFELALDEIRATGSRILNDKVSGQDVTEEFIDLAARIKTQKALEAQFLEIMKQARKVADALEVQRQIADVRTEIEELEGRIRFLENRTSLATIMINLQSPRPVIVSSAGFGHTIKESIADGVAVASSIVLFLVRTVIILIPVLTFIFVPGFLGGRYFVRRARRLRLARQLEATPES